MAVEIGVEALTRAQLVSVARSFEPVTLSDAVMSRLARQRAAIDALVESGTPVYGLSTGFGSLATTFISPDERRDLQRSLIRSHAAGVGPEVETDYYNFESLNFSLFSERNSRIVRALHFQRKHFLCLNIAVSKAKAPLPRSGTS